MKKVISRFIIIIIIFNMFSAQCIAYAKDKEEIIGYAYNSDIVTYINEKPIRSYNFEGYTLVAVNDLYDY